MAHSLDRPSSFGTTSDHINAGFFSDVDDEHITVNGIVPGSPSSTKKHPSIHFFRMRLCQAEKLYLNRVEELLKLWFTSMDQNLKDWLSSRPPCDERSGFNDEWCICNLLPITQPSL